MTLEHKSTRTKKLQRQLHNNHTIQYSKTDRQDTSGNTKTQELDPPGTKLRSSR